MSPSTDSIASLLTGLGVPATAYSGGGLASRSPIDGASLDIAVIPTFAMRWLIPRLPQFQQQHPNICVHLAERMEPFVLAGSGFDAALHFEHPAWTGMRTYPLSHEVLVPVCHPALLKAGLGANALDTLPRLHRRQNPDAWERYVQVVLLSNEFVFVD